jgi:hypothetical protein
LWLETSFVTIVGETISVIQVMKLNPPLPNEHGSWAMLIVPLLLGLIVAPAWHGRALLLVVVAFGFYLVRFPLAVLVKTRRRARPERAYLWRWTVIYGTLTAIGGGWLVLGEGLWWLAVIGLAGGALLLFHLWLVARRQEMSVAGELSGIVGLALGAPMACYAAGGRLEAMAWVLWLINALYFGGTVFYIKLKVRQQPRQPAPDRLSERLIKARACLTYQTAALTIIIVLVAIRQAPLLTPLALAPGTIKIVWGAWQWQDKRSLSLVRLGVTEIFHAVAFMVLVAIAFR